MNRRTVRRQIAAASVLASAAPVLAPAGQTRAASLASTPETIGSSAAFAVDQLAAMIGAPAWCPAAHLVRRSGSESVAGRVAVERAAQQGYREIDAALVFLSTDRVAGTGTLFFPITDTGGAHALAPFIYASGESHGFTMLGGPALVGLAAQARWLATTAPHLSGPAIGRVLLPSGDYSYY